MHQVFPLDIIYMIDGNLPNRDHDKLILAFPELSKYLRKEYLQSRVDVETCVKYGFKDLFWLYPKEEVYYYAKIHNSKLLKEFTVIESIDELISTVDLIKQSLVKDKIKMHVRNELFCRYSHIGDISGSRRVLNRYKVDQPLIEVNRLDIKLYEFTKEILYDNLHSEDRIHQKIFVKHISNIAYYFNFDIRDIISEFELNPDCPLIREIANYDYFYKKSTLSPLFLELSKINHPKFASQEEAVSKLDKLQININKRKDQFYLVGSSVLYCVLKNPKFVPNDVDLCYEDYGLELYCKEIKKGLGSLKHDLFRMDPCHVVDFHFAPIRCYYSFGTNQFYLSCSCVVGILDDSLGRPKCVFKGKNTVEELVEKYQERGFKLPEEHRKWYEKNKK